MSAFTTAAPILIPGIVFNAPAIALPAKDRVPTSTIVSSIFLDFSLFLIPQILAIDSISKASVGPKIAASESGNVTPPTAIPANVAALTTACDRALLKMLYSLTSLYTLRINNNSYSYKAVLAELYKTDYVITDYYSMSHSIWVDDDTGCRCILNFQPNNGIVTIRGAYFLGPDHFMIVSTEENIVNESEVRYKVLYGYDMYVDSLSTL